VWDRPARYFSALTPVVPYLDRNSSDVCGQMCQLPAKPYLVAMTGEDKRQSPFRAGRPCLTSPVTANLASPRAQAQHRASPEPDDSQEQGLHGSLSSTPSVPHLSYSPFSPRSRVLALIRYPMDPPSTAINDGDATTQPTTTASGSDTHGVRDAIGYDAG
jgi:hypothetical protein